MEFLDKKVEIKTLAIWVLSLVVAVIFWNWLTDSKATKVAMDAQIDRENTEHKEIINLDINAALKERADVVRFEAVYPKSIFEYQDFIDKNSGKALLLEDLKIRNVFKENGITFVTVELPTIPGGNIIFEIEVPKDSVTSNKRVQTLDRFNPAAFIVFPKNYRVEHLYANRTSNYTVAHAILVVRAVLDSVFRVGFD